LSDACHSQSTPSRLLPRGNYLKKPERSPLEGSYVCIPAIAFIPCQPSPSPPPAPLCLAPRFAAITMRKAARGSLGKLIKTCPRLRPPADGLSPSKPRRQPDIIPSFGDYRTLASNSIPRFSSISFSPPPPPRKRANEKARERGAADHVTRCDVTGGGASENADRGGG
jgi:hypothetical protein